MRKRLHRMDNPCKGFRKHCAQRETRIVSRRHSKWRAQLGHTPLVVAVCGWWNYCSSDCFNSTIPWFQITADEVMLVLCSFSWYLNHAMTMTDLRLWALSQKPWQQQVRAGHVHHLFPLETVLVMFWTKYLINTKCCAWRFSMCVRLVKMLIHLWMYLCMYLFGRILFICSGLSSWGH